MNPFTIPDTLVHAVSTRIIALLAFLSAVGGLSAALTKAVEDFSWVKIAFNRNFLTAWLEQRLAPPKTPKKERIFGLRGGNLQARARALSVEGAWTEMVSLCAAGDERALLELEDDQICGQLNSAAQIVLAYPALYANLYGALTAGALPGDVTLVAQPLQAGAGAQPTVTQDRRDAQTRISNFIQRSVDALHIRLDQRWAWWQQVASFLFGAGITYAAMVLGGFTSGSGLESFIKVVIAAVVTAFLAPLARDITAAVKSWST